MQEPTPIDVIKAEKLAHEILMHVVDSIKTETGTTGTSAISASGFSRTLARLTTNQRLSGPDYGRLTVAMTYLLQRAGCSMQHGEDVSGDVSDAE